MTSSPGVGANPPPGPTTRSNGGLLRGSVPGRVAPTPGTPVEAEVAINREVAHAHQSNNMPPSRLQTQRGPVPEYCPERQGHMKRRLRNVLLIVGFGLRDLADWLGLWDRLPHQHRMRIWKVLGMVPGGKS